MRGRARPDEIGLALLAAALGACTPTDKPGWAGYTEGEYVLVAAPVAGMLVQLPTRAGRPVARGQTLFTLESDAESAALAEADARERGAAAQAQNINYGRRAEELAVTRAQLDQARAAATLAAADLNRQQALVAQAFVSPARLNEAQRCDELCDIAYGKVLAMGDAAQIVAQADASDLEDAFVRLVVQAQDNFA